MSRADPSALPCQGQTPQSFLNDRMLIYDAMGNEFTKVEVSKSPACPLCGVAPSIIELRDELGAMNACTLKP